MGMPMALNLIKAGYQVTVFNRTTSKAEKIVAQGATKAASPRDVAAASSVIITIVSDTPDLEEVVLGGNGVIHGIRSDSVLMDMSTVSPAATRQIAEKLKEKQCHMLDAPVSGGEQGAIDGTLSIMVGGDIAVFDRCRPVLEAMGKNIIHVGSGGMGQTVKLINQILVAGTLNAVVEALVFGMKNGVDLEKAIDAVKGGAAGSWQLSNLAPRIIRRDFRPGFKVGLIKKDLKLVMETAENSGTPLPVTRLVYQMFSDLQAAAEGESGTQALAKVLEKLAGTECRQSSTK
jgi:3-hydroxyisobutyrate dehydrogenase